MHKLFVVIRMLMLIVDDGHQIYSKDEIIYTIVFGITVFYH